MDNDDAFFMMETGDLPFDAEEPDEILDLIKKQRFNFKAQVSQLETDLIYSVLGVSESERPTASVFLDRVRLFVSQSACKNDTSTGHCSDEAKEAGCKSDDHEAIESPETDDLHPTSSPTEVEDKSFCGSYDGD